MAVCSQSLLRDNTHLTERFVAELHNMKASNAEKMRLAQQLKDLQTKVGRCECC